MMVVHLVKVKEAAALPSMASMDPPKRTSKIQNKAYNVVCRIKVKISLFEFGKIII